MHLDPNRVIKGKEFDALFYLVVKIGKRMRFIELLLGLNILTICIYGIIPRHAIDAAFSYLSKVFIVS